MPDIPAIIVALKWQIKLKKRRHHVTKFEGHKTNAV